MGSRKFTDLELERLLCGDLPKTETARFEAEATTNDEARLQELRSDGEAFLAEVGVHKQVVAISQRARPRTKAFSILGPILATACAVAAVFLFVSRPSELAQPLYQSKGGEMRFSIHVATDAGSRPLVPSDVVPARARLRFVVAAEQPGFVAVVGIDSADLLSVYYPRSGRLAVAYEPSTPALPGAIELDDTPGEERFYAIYGSRVFDAQEIGAMVLSRDAVPSELEIVEFSVLKPAR